VKRFLLPAILCFAFGIGAFAQQNDETPASTADIQTLFETLNSRDQVNKTIDAMLQAEHQLIHEQYLKDKDRLPEDFEARLLKYVDDLMKNMPYDEMMQAMVPAYQRHFTKGDVYAILSFYSSPTGQKMLREMPAILNEAMQSAMPIMTRYLEEVRNKLQREMGELIEQSEKKTEQAPKK
jgi:hypothetical protein